MVQGSMVVLPEVVILLKVNIPLQVALQVQSTRMPLQEVATLQKTNIQEILSKKPDLKDLLPAGVTLPEAHIIPLEDHLLLVEVILLEMNILQVTQKEQIHTDLHLAEDLPEMNIIQEDQHQEVIQIVLEQLQLEVFPQKEKNLQEKHQKIKVGFPEVMTAEEALFLLMMVTAQEVVRFLLQEVNLLVVRINPNVKTNFINILLIFCPKSVCIGVPLYNSIY